MRDVHVKVQGERVGKGGKVLHFTRVQVHQANKYSKGFNDLLAKVGTDERVMDDDGNRIPDNS